MSHEVRGVVARFREAPVSLETIRVPDPGPGEALVRVQACGMCHTDLHYRDGAINDEFPFLLGHEAAGTVEAVGLPETYKQAFFARDLAGKLIQVGVPSPEMQIDLPLIELFGRGGALKSSWYGDCLPSRDFPILIDLYLQGKLDLDGFVSETISIDQVEHAFARMQRGEVLRSVVVL